MPRIRKDNVIVDRSLMKWSKHPDYVYTCVYGPYLVYVEMVDELDDYPYGIWILRQSDTVSLENKLAYGEAKSFSLAKAKAEELLSEVIVSS